ncbi:MAG: hypothetical protein JNJ63_07165 [Hyphomonadaceae bacterium]|nr:hypothetical protein [Hyphomonadaceae bacterium]
MSGLISRNLIRVCAAALALSTLSFAAGVAGDLSEVRQRSGERVVLRIPPELPANTPRAGPLPPRTPSAAAAERRPAEPRATAAPDREAALQPLSVSEAFAMLEGGPLESPQTLDVIEAPKPVIEFVSHEVKPAESLAQKPQIA